VDGKTDEILRRAVAAHQGGRLVEAEALYRLVLEKEPGNADALNLMGVLAHQRGKHARAVELIGRAIGIKPGMGEFHVNLATVLGAMNRREEAVVAARRAVELNPGSVMGQFNCGRLLAGLGRFEEAAGCFRKAVELQSGFADGWNELGMALKDQGKFAEAEEAFERAVKLQPGSGPFRTNLGNALKDQNKLEEALREFAEAARLRPEVALVHHNLGVVMAGLGDLDGAIEKYRLALRIQPDHVTARGHLGQALLKKGKYEEGVAELEEAVHLRPEDGDAHWNLGWNMLLVGNYERGWKEFEWRWKSSIYAGIARRFPELQWDGGDIKGKRIFIYWEGGLGDAIHFARYVPLLAERGARVILEVQPELVSLLKQLPGLEQILAAGETPPAFDVACPMMSLPLCFGTRVETIPAEIPYLFPDPARAKAWEAKVPKVEGKLRVGLVWAGNPKNKNDLTRTIGLAKFAPLAAAKNVRFYSLQVGASAAQANSPPAGMQVVNYSAELKDFADTAGLIANLDLVISVDTSVAHVAGAMGKPVWDLIPFTPDWRWMLEREDNAWYPTMRLFRQKRGGDWDGVVARVAEALIAETRNSGTS
jgi:tetratricopeptide (TPR) repeat protein